MSLVEVVAVSCLIKLSHCFIHHSDLYNQTNTSSKLSLYEFIEFTEQYHVLHQDDCKHYLLELKAFRLKSNSFLCSSLLSNLQLLLKLDLNARNTRL